MISVISLTGATYLLCLPHRIDTQIAPQDQTGASIAFDCVRRITQKHNNRQAPNKPTPMYGN